jgi:hypothetical protein
MPAQNAVSNQEIHPLLSMQLSPLFMRAVFLEQNNMTTQFDQVSVVKKRIFTSTANVFPTQYCWLTAQKKP